LWQVAIVAVCAAGTTVAYALGRWDEQWVGWLSLFLAMEVGAALSRESGDTFSERIWAWCGVRPVRPGRWWRVGAIAVFLGELVLHFAAGPGYWWSGEEAVIVTAIPLVVAIVSGFRSRPMRVVPICLMAALLVGCDEIPIPKPTPTPAPTATPTPEPTPKPCQIEAPWCHELEPPATCSTPQRPCLHNPTQDPNHCELAPACPVDPTPTPDPPPAACAPVLDPAKSAPIAGDSSWPAAADQSEANAWKQSVWAAVAAAKASCPAAWRTDKPDCLKDGPSAIDHGYKLISKALQNAGMSASQAVVGGERKDHLWVQRAPGSNDWNATKLFNYGDGCLITGDGAFNVHGWYTYSGGPTPTPGPDPTPVAGCSTPLPPKLWTAETLPDGWGSDMIGQPRWEIGCAPHGNVVDCTAKVAPRACDYCASIGMGDIGGQPRCGCPVRNECPGFKCEERVACEAYLTGGTKLESRNGATCEFAHGNPFQFKPSGGNCRLCSVGDPRVCGDWW